MAKFPFYNQFDQKDCGPACLRMIAKYYGEQYSLEYLRDACHINKYGTSMLSLSDGAEEIGFKTMAVRLSSQRFYDRAILPCIAYVNGNHFVVVYKVTKTKVYIANPAKGIEVLTKEDFEKRWLQDRPEGKTGTILMMETTSDFNKKNVEGENKALSYFFKYVTPFKREIVQTIIGLLFGSIIAFIIPFISQSVIDYGINGQNLEFVQLMIIAEIVLTVSSTMVGLIQSWLQLHVGTKMSIAMLSDFIHKILKLPISFISNRSIGDILQRMSDNGRVLSFITSSPIAIIFSILNLIIYGSIMVSYSSTILMVFVAGNILYGLWLFAFLKKRRELDYENFELNSKSESNTLELFNGIQEIKLNNIEREKRWQWEDLKAQQYNLSMKGLKVSQIQSTGSLIINHAKNILISYIAAKSVISGDMTMGMMFSVQYMIGQLNLPFSTFLGFIHSVQDVKISIERLSEINDKEPEGMSDYYIEELPTSRTLSISNLTFRYEGKSSDPALNKINVEFPQNKITAIVGKSGSGKTTLLKLLLKLYAPSEGEIKIGNDSLHTIRTREWRDVCGSVMQDSFIFDDSIVKNITLSEVRPNMKRLMEISQRLNILEFVENLPQKFNTKIGGNNHKLSIGQYQRILLARAIYKNPDILILDEVTSSLDTENENSVMEFLNELKGSKTIIIAAHRLSTIMNADQIVVIDNGEIAEVGTHSELISEKQGLYYNLVTNKLDL